MLGEALHSNTKVNCGFCGSPPRFSPPAPNGLSDWGFHRRALVFFFSLFHSPPPLEGMLKEEGLVPQMAALFPSGKIFQVQLPSLIDSATPLFASGIGNSPL